MSNAAAIIPGITAFFDPATFTASYVVADPASRRAAIIDPVLVGFKSTEFLVEAKQAGLPVISRFGTWQKPPPEEVAQLRFRRLL